MSRKKDFKQEDKMKAVLWCARHCCLCGKSTGVKIELAHIDEKISDNSLENGIPLCFDCHAEIGHYNDRHPRGVKYSPNELKKFRNQIYDQYTAHLLSPVQCSIYQYVREGDKIKKAFHLPKVGCTVSHSGTTFPLKARIDIEIYHDGKKNKIITAGHHDGRYLWNLNPGFSINGHFEIQPELDPKEDRPLMAKINICVIDIYEREHDLLPVGYINKGDEWYAEPCMEALF